MLLFRGYIMLHTTKTTNTLAYQRVNNDLMAQDDIRHAVSLKPVSSRQKLRVNITGGGPVGLILASSLKELFHHHIDVRIFDDRWKQTSQGVSWKSLEDKNKRRLQVVTIQSKPLAMLPPILKKALLPTDGFAEIWPYSEDSPLNHGRPKNIRIVDIEDRLLQHALKMGVQLIPNKYCLDNIQHSSFDVLAICEGANSKTRDNLGDKFGNTDPTPYSINGNHLHDVVLGLKIKSNMDSAQAVVLTIVQNRFLLNVDQNGEGYLNMRLTTEEASEFKTGNNMPSLRLWSRILQGMKLFDISPDSLEAITSYPLSMEHRSRFSATLNWNFNGKPMYGFLLGDAANAIHFWSGRGLNQGLLSAVSLARCLHERCHDGRGLREADFSKHEAVMHMLQHRHKTRAWHSMVKRVDGQIKPIKELIAEGLQKPSAPRSQLLEQLSTRCLQTINRLQRRLPGLPTEDVIKKRLQIINDETLASLLSSSPWDTYQSGGPEVDLDMFYPKKAGDYYENQYN